MPLKHDKEGKNKDSSKNGWIWWALGIYIFFVLVYSVCFIKSDGNNLLLPSNELGDFLAGVVSPVAFLFLIMGYLQQKDVIAQNTKVLSEQMEELKLSKKLMVETNQPRFSFEGIEQNFKEKFQSSSIRFKIKNENQDCTIQQFIFLEDSEKYMMSGDVFRFLSRGESLQCQVNVKKPMEYDDSPETMFAIQYLDIFGNIKKLYYVLQHTPDKTVIYTAPVERVARYNANE